MNLRLVASLFGAILIVTSMNASAARNIPYKSLGEFCLKTGADTAANCKCGDKTAREIASPKERQVLLTMMAGDAEQRQQAMTSIDPVQMKALMTKMNKITKGCKGQ